MAVLRIVDGVPTRHISGCAFSMFANATRHLAYACHPAPRDACHSCEEVILDGPWALVEEVTCNQALTMLSPLAYAIRIGEIRYCVATGQFLRCKDWSLAAATTARAAAAALSPGQCHTDEGVARSAAAVRQDAFRARLAEVKDKIRMARDELAARQINVLAERPRQPASQVSGLSDYAHSACAAQRPLKKGEVLCDSAGWSPEQANRIGNPSGAADSSRVHCQVAPTQAVPSHDGYECTTPLVTDVRCGSSPSCAATFVRIAPLTDKCSLQNLMSPAGAFQPYGKDNPPAIDQQASSGTAVAAFQDTSSHHTSAALLGQDALEQPRQPGSGPGDTGVDGGQDIPIPPWLLEPIDISPYLVDPRSQEEIDSEPVLRLPRLIRVAPTT